MRFRKLNSIEKTILRHANADAQTLGTLPWLLVMLCWSGSMLSGRLPYATITSNQAEKVRCCFQYGQLTLYAGFRDIGWTASPSQAYNVYRKTAFHGSVARESRLDIILCDSSELHARAQESLMH